MPYTAREQVRAKHPAGTVSVRLAGDGGGPVPESAVIVAWAEAYVPEPPFVSAAEPRAHAPAFQQHGGP